MRAGRQVRATGRIDVCLRWLLIAYLAAGHSYLVAFDLRITAVVPGAAGPVLADPYNEGRDDDPANDTSAVVIN
jgi:hypothetical protein